jgi:hypothetical protein
MNPTPAQSSDVKFEIGHVLFVDIVGYSKLLINEQSEQIQKLNQIVSATKQFRLAEAEDKLLRLPTGDGGALISHQSGSARVVRARYGATSFTRIARAETGLRDERAGGFRKVVGTGSY